MTKWIVRADCWPPSAVTRTGKTDVMAGDIANPVQIINGKSTNTTADTSTTTECVETLLATSPFGPSNLALTTARSPDLTTFRLSLGLQYLSAIRNLEPQTTGPARSQEAL